MPLLNPPPDSDPMQPEMSTRTPLVLNGVLVAFTALLMVGYDGFVGLLWGATLAFCANGLMFAKALRWREHHLAILYFLLAAGPVALVFFLGSSYGHR